ncbi:RNA binding protein, partial [Oryctes borbonicus]
MDLSSKSIEDTKELNTEKVENKDVEIPQNNNPAGLKQVHENTFQQSSKCIEDTKELNTEKVENKDVEIAEKNNSAGLKQVHENTFQQDGDNKIITETTSATVDNNEPHQNIKENSNLADIQQLNTNSTLKTDDSSTIENNDKGFDNQTCNAEVQYGFEDDAYIYTDSDGVKFFWDKERNAWFPKINDDFLAQYQMNYGFVDYTSKEVKQEEKPKVEKILVPRGVKRKPNEPTWFELDEEHNTKVYVSNLPTDTTEEEFVDLMQKCGLVMRDPITQQMKIKLYKEPGTDYLKGDALCTYIRVESVDLALKLLNDSMFKGKKIKIERAKFQMRGKYDPKLKPKMKKRKEKEKFKKMQEKLFDWRPERMRGERAKHEKIVIVKNLFDPKVFDEEVGLILEYQQDLREECSKCGEVRKVTVYDRHPEGVVQINMKEQEEADAVVTLLNGRWFDKRKLTAEIWDGKTKFKIAETDSEISQRVNKWDKFLEGENENKAN